MQSHWYENFFHGVALDLWRAVVSPEATHAEVGFLVRTLELAPGARVLDVPCGLGRHSQELARRGYRVTGVDISEDCLERARADAALKGLSVEWVRAGMHRLEWERQFHGAFCWGNSFGYTEHEDTLAFLAGVARALKPGARFLLETGTAAECILPTFQPLRQFQVGGIQMRLEQGYDPRCGRLVQRFTFIRDGVEDTRSASQAVYTSAEIRRMLAATGFDVEGLYSNVAGAEFELGAHDLIVLARKSST